MRKVPLNEASDAQLRAFLTAQQVEGVGGARNRPELLALLTPVWDQSYILAEAEAPQEDAAQSERAHPTSVIDYTNSAAYSQDPVVELTIGQSSLVGGKHPATPSVNGKTLVIQRGVRVKVPYRFYLDLRDSERVETDDKMNGTSVTAYPLTIHRLPSDEEVDAWFEATKDLEIA
jgi:hypothetical protein